MNAKRASGLGATYGNDGTSQHITIIVMAISIVMMAMTLPYASAATDNSTIMVGGSDIRVSLVNQDPDPAAAGDIVELRIGVENQGQTAISDLVVEVDPSYPFLEVQGEDLMSDVGTMSGYQVGEDMRIVKIKLRVDTQATAGDYDLKVSTYRKGSSSRRTETVIPITVATRKNVQVIYVDKTVIVPGKETPLTFTINNVGRSTLHNLQFRWENDDGIILPVSGTAGRYVDSIEIDDSVEIEYMVMASTNADPDLYPIDLILTYDDPSGSGESTFTTTAGIYVGGETDFEVSFDSSTGGEVSLNIANTGSNPASAVSVNLPQQQGWRVTGTRTSMVGSLAKGDYTIASFAAQGTGDLMVDVAYTDTMGNRRNEEYTIDIDTPRNVTEVLGTGANAGARAGRQTTASQGLSITAIVGIVIAALIVAGGAYWFIRRRSGKRK